MLKTKIDCYKSKVQNSRFEFLKQLEEDGKPIHVSDDLRKKLGMKDYLKEAIELDCKEEHVSLKKGKLAKFKEKIQSMANSSQGSVSEDFVDENGTETEERVIGLVGKCPVLKAKMEELTERTINERYQISSETAGSEIQQAKQDQFEVLQ